MRENQSFMLICFVIVTFYFISLVFQKLEGPGSQQTGAGLGGGPGVPGQEHAGSGIPVPYGIPPAPAGRSQQLKVGDPSKQLGKEGKGTHLHETTNKQTSNTQEINPTTSKLISYKNVPSTWLLGLS